MPSEQPGIITIPPMNYVAVRGQGNPNEETGEYKQATVNAYSYTIITAHKEKKRITE